MSGWIAAAVLFLGALGEGAVIKTTAWEMSELKSHNRSLVKEIQRLRSQADDQQADLIRLANTIESQREQLAAKDAQLAKYARKHDAKGRIVGRA